MISPLSGRFLNEAIDSTKDKPQDGENKYWVSVHHSLPEKNKNKKETTPELERVCVGDV